MNIKNLKLNGALACGLALSVSLAGVGCGKRSNCYIPERHVHKYINNVGNGTTITAYFDSESLDLDDFSWTEEFIDVTQIDAKVFKLLTREKLFDAETNWNYLYHKMASHHDYLEFFWEYDTKEIYTTKDDDGNIEIHTRTVHHEGWSLDPYHSDTNGTLRVCHHRYRAFCIVSEKGKFKLKSSPLVDDIRNASYKFPYVSKNCDEIVSKEYKRSPKELPKLTVNDFPRFEGPRLDCKDYYLPNAEVDYQWSIPKKEDRIIPDSSSEHTLSPANNSYSFNTGFCNSNFFDSLTRKSNFNRYNTHVAEKTLKRKYH